VVNGFSGSGGLSGSLQLGDWACGGWHEDGMV